MDEAREGVRLGPQVAVLRKSATYIVVAALIFLCVLATDAAVFLHGEAVIASVVAAASLLVVVIFVRSQLGSRLFIHERGLRVVNRSEEEVVAWTDILEIKPTFSTLPHPNTLIDLAIVRRSGGRVVLHNNWVPRAPFVQMITKLVFKNQ